MPRRTMRRRAACSLVTATIAVPVLAAPAHAFTDFTKTETAAQQRQDRERSSAQAIVKGAKARIGAGYAMGGNGPGAFDCSGLTTAAFAAADIALPRTSQAQFAQGKPVDRDEIRAGDLVFFSTNGPGASHVGVATGRTTVVSATSSGVMEHPSTDAYWGGSYVGARRVS